VRQTCALASICPTFAFPEWTCVFSYNAASDAPRLRGAHPVARARSCAFASRHKRSKSSKKRRKESKKEKKRKREKKHKKEKRAKKDSKEKKEQKETSAKKGGGAAQSFSNREARFGAPRSAPSSVECHACILMYALSAAPQFLNNAYDSSGDDDVPRSVISGAKIQRNLHKSKEDKEEEARRTALLRFMNAMH
jgi:hypothetical protein